MKFVDKLVRADPLVLLGQAGFQSKIEFAPGDRLGKEVWNACHVFSLFRFGYGLEDVRETVCQLQCFLKGCDLLLRDLDGDLNPGFPTPFFDIEYTVLRVILVFDSFRTKEERDAIRELVRRWVRIHVPAL